jgi:chromosomal replication initiation ATPase DnaA
MSAAQKEMAMNACCEYIEKKTKKYTRYTADKVLERLDRQGIILNRLKTRDRIVVENRQIVMYFLRNRTDLSYQQIGNFCGGFNYATVLHACNMVRNFCEVDKHYRQKIELLNEKI